MHRRHNRRRFLLSSSTVLATAPLIGLAKEKHKPDPDEGVTAPEDLMKEHGVLNRCLLIYEEGMRRLRRRDDLNPEVSYHTAELVRTFVEQYHEMNEEKYIFPPFERAKVLVELVQVLKQQHKAGREVTARILELSQPAQFRNSQTHTELLEACGDFIRMYRPHESREDTVLFPALRTSLKPKQVEELGERMEEDEHNVLGEEGFEQECDTGGNHRKATGHLRPFPIHSQSVN